MVALAWLLATAACSFSFGEQAAEQGGDAADAAIDVADAAIDMADAAIEEDAHEALINIRIRPGVVGYADCHDDEVLIGGGGSCGNAGLSSSIPHVPDAGPTAATRRWLVRCSDGSLPTNSSALCASGSMAKEITRFGASMGTDAIGVTAPCGKQTVLIGGGCSCAAGALQITQPDRVENLWDCKCTALGRHEAFAICAPEKYWLPVHDKINTGKEGSASSRCSGVRMSGGGESEGFLLRSTPETGAAWQLEATEAVTVIAICFDPP